ncbi:MAG TPA: OmpA family protein [Acidisoma sp.]|uniref:OmpA family protein n=1 Tax=Acidisoma sp. TaxID=1872115 RepID=UPI002B5E396A|nr:OmpA family protein [Acidisoma sp.]HTI03165.1 OmpA family protein [Acidisoma sp.]
MSWWHGLEGGAIARDRPPPPKANAPYPHIANAPARPAGMPDWEWRDLQATLASQGAAAHQYATDNPIPTLPSTPGQTPAQTQTLAAAKPVPAPATPAATAAATPSTADQDAIRRLAAAPGPAGSQASAPPPATVAAAATAAATRAPASGSTVTLDTSSAAPGSKGPGEVPVNAAGQAETRYKTFDANNGLSVPGALGPVAQPDEAHPPPVPTSVPAPANVPGFAISATPSTYTPPKAVPQPAPYVPPAPLPDVAPVPITFAPGSAILSPPMQRALRDLAQARQGNRIAITGFGSATATAVGVQAAAMPLALERARAITVQLMANGVPMSRLVTTAEAQGQGGLARLVD